MANLEKKLLCFSIKSSTDVFERYKPKISEVCSSTNVPNELNSLISSCRYLIRSSFFSLAQLYRLISSVDLSLIQHLLASVSKNTAPPPTNGSIKRPVYEGLYFLITGSSFSLPPGHFNIVFITSSLHK